MVSLAQLFKEKLTSSGITSQQAKKLGIQICEKPAKLQIKYKQPGILIPYHTVEAKPTKFYRYRYIADPRSKLEKLTSSKPLRYVQPYDTTPEVYMPPCLPWKSILQDAARPLIITEGEFKAACACLNTQHPTVGLGGVWSWRAARQGVDLLPWFKDVVWKNRIVYIVYDSDAATNPDVLRAEVFLAKKRLDMGAALRIVRLPHTQDGGKQGMDDYIVAEGVAAFDALLEDAEDYQPSIELHTLNTEVAYVTNPGLIYRLDNKQRLSCGDFIAHAYANRKFTEMQQMPNGGYKTVVKSLPKTWVEWPQRLAVERLDYVPGQPDMLPNKTLNTWSGWGCAPTEGDISPWSRLLDFLFKDSPPADRLWFERWLAYPLQNPGTKMYTAVIMWGRLHGTGKSLIGYTMFQIYGKNAVEIKERDLKESFNEWAENKQFAMGEEITGGDKRGLADTLKHMITAQQLRVNAKYIPSYTVADRINYYFTSNHCDSFFLEDDDRRYFVHEVTGAPLSEEFYREYDKWLRSGAAGPAVFAHLLNLDLGEFNPNARAPMTASKEDMIVTNRSDLGDWVATLREAPDAILRIGDLVLPYSLWRNQDLLRLYDPDARKNITAVGIGREMRRAGFRQAAIGKPVRTAVGQTRVWMVRNIARLERQGQAQIGIIYDKERSEFKGQNAKSLKHNKR